MTPSPSELWHQAYARYPEDRDARRACYHALMVERGHIVKRQPDRSVNLRCGWPHRPEPGDG